MIRLPRSFGDRVSTGGIMPPLSLAQATTSRAALNKINPNGHVLCLLSSQTDRIVFVWVAMSTPRKKRPLDSLPAAPPRLFLDALNGFADTDENLQRMLRQADKRMTAVRIDYPFIRFLSGEESHPLAGVVPHRRRSTVDPFPAKSSLIAAPNVPVSARPQSTSRHNDLIQVGVGLKADSHATVTFNSCRALANF